MRHFWALLFGVVLAAAFMLFAVAPAMGWWLPTNVSTYGGDVDLLFYVILGVTGFFFVLTEAILVYNMYRFAGEPGRKAQYRRTATTGWKWSGRSCPASSCSSWPSLQINVWADIKYPSHMAEHGRRRHVARFCRWKSRPGSGSCASAIPAPSTWRNGPTRQKTTASRNIERRLPEQRDDVYDVNEVHTWKGQKTVVFLRDAGRQPQLLPARSAA